MAYLQWDLSQGSSYCACYTSCGIMQESHIKTGNIGFLYCSLRCSALFLLFEVSDGKVYDQKI